MRIFLAGGESRHWVHFPFTELKNEDISCGRVLQKHGKRNQTDCMGGIVPDKEVINETISCKPSHSHEIPRRTTSGDFPARGGIPSIDENILCRSDDGRKLEKRRYASDTLRGGFSYSELNENIHGRHSSMWGGQAEYYRNAIKEHRPFILESFYYADATTEKLIPYFGDFLLDSGAFTFMQNSKTHVVWEDYIEKYADFINRNKIEKFFELDIDSVVGYDKVLEYRRKLEKLTNRACIPVWHISRGLQEFKKMCEEYDYVALGGIVGEKRGGTKYQQYHAAFPFFINEAHKKNVLIHGLGYTDLEGLKKYHFDSVDSTAWTTGNRFGYIYRFNGKTMIKHDVPKGKRLADSRKVAEINYLEWLKFQKWAINNL